MVPALASLLLALAGSGPVGAVPPDAAAGGAAGATVRLDAPDDVKRLCAALAPVERLRAKGDAVARGEAERAHERARGRALAARYAATIAAGGLELAFDPSEGTLALAEPAQLPVAGATARLWPALDGGLPVEVSADTARRIVEAQRAGHLALGLEFALPDDATCGTGARGTRFVVPVEPIAWRWTNDESVVAAGGAAAERPLAMAAQGATPRVTVGAPISGPAGARRGVTGRSAELEACYGEALRRAPALDGVLVAQVGDGRTRIAADSVGDAELAACVVRALGTVGGGAAAVPIRFDLEATSPQPRR